MKTTAAVLMAGQRRGRCVCGGVAVLSGGAKAKARGEESNEGRSATGVVSAQGSAPAPERQAPESSRTY